MTLGVRHFTDNVLMNLENEARAAETKHGRDKTLFSYQIPLHHKLAVLLEEVGEVGKCLTYDGDINTLDKELLQVANLALAWYQSLQPL